MDEGNAVKKRLVFTFLIGGFIGFLMVIPTHYALKNTSDDKFCVVCHEMQPMVISYTKDIHSGIGKTGIKAECVDCHLPHDNLIKYVYTKARNGVVEGYIHFFGDPDKIDWHQNRKHKEKFVFDNGCLNCHKNILQSSEASNQAHKMHTHYTKLLNTDKELKCVSCHIDVGHAGELRNYLEYWSPKYQIYEKKMMQRKIQEQENFFKNN